MNIYKVELTYTTVVRAANQQDAERTAEQVVLNGDEPEPEIHSKIITKTSEIPPPWDQKCIPWGERDDFDRTLEELLEKD